MLAYFSRKLRQMLDSSFWVLFEQAKFFATDWLRSELYSTKMEEDNYNRNNGFFIHAETNQKKVTRVPLCTELLLSFSYISAAVV